MKQVRKVLGLFGGVDRGICLLMVPAALLDTLEGCGIRFSVLAQVICGEPEG